ncbi:unnamed protein product [Thelazia callipaeda]|uniref:Uncharacterized protein n=1 Tax=Thelazia callipaeda TaxID=103827 RepID=A0A0N5CXH7_THECL|nr:unnamed protein product [Thelazia callipaeda]
MMIIVIEDDMMNLPEERQQYNPSRPYWLLIDQVNDKSGPVDYMNNGDKILLSKKPFHPIILENQAAKQKISSGMKGKGTNGEYYGSLGSSNSIKDYIKRSSFRQLALNGARGFGK